MARLRDADYWFLVAEDGGLPVAMACAGPARADEGVGALIPGACFLGYVYVVPERWGQGIGGMILDAMVDEARRRGFHRIELFTHEDDNSRAHGLYRSRKFEPTGEIREDEQGTRIGRWAREESV